jgi:hypothetical protein
MYHEDGSLNYAPAFFVASYVIIVAWILLQAGPGEPSLEY